MLRLVSTSLRFLTATPESLTDWSSANKTLCRGGITRVSFVTYIENRFCNW